MIDQLVGPGDEVGIDGQGTAFGVDRSRHHGHAAAAKGSFHDPGVARVQPGRDRGARRGLEHPVLKQVGAGQSRTVPAPQRREGRADERARSGMSDRLPALNVAPGRAQPGRQPARSAGEQRGVGERRVDPVAQGDENAAARFEELRERR